MDLLYRQWHRTAVEVEHLKLSGSVEECGIWEGLLDQERLMLDEFKVKLMKAVADLEALEHGEAERSPVFIDMYYPGRYPEAQEILVASAVQNSIGAGGMTSW